MYVSIHLLHILEVPYSNDFMSAVFRLYPYQQLYLNNENQCANKGKNWRAGKQTQKYTMYNLKYWLQYAK